MSHLDILLPFALPPTELANDLLFQLQAPSFATLLARSGLKAQLSSDPYSRSLPHEQWLATQYGLSPASENSPPLAPALMQSFGMAFDQGTWFILHPSHLHVARDHLVLTDWHRLPLNETESRSLFEAAQPLFEETGLTLLYGDTHHWVVRADEWAGLLTSTPDAASGHNIDIWLPKGEHERAWRRLHNEVQMTWHIHEVNAQREARGANPVNALWLWGGASAAELSTLPLKPDSFSLPEAHHVFARVQQQTLPLGRIDALIASQPKRALVILDKLIAPALAQDWGDWLNCYHRLEEQMFSPLLAALKAGTIDSVSLIATDNTQAIEWAITRNGLRKFWARPSLTKLSP